MRRAVGGGEEKARKVGKGALVLVDVDGVHSIKSARASQDDLVKGLTGCILSSLLVYCPFLGIFYQGVEYKKPGLVRGVGKG